MKTVFVGNMCNFAYWYAKWSQRLGYEAMAIIESDVIPRDRPEWEDPEYDPAHPPEWIRHYPLAPVKRLWPDRRSLRRFQEALSAADTIHTFTMYAAILVANLGRRFVHHTLGSFERSSAYLPHSQSLRGVLSPRRLQWVWRFRKALTSCEAIIASTPTDTIEVRNSGRAREVIPIPVAYDAEMVHPLRTPPTPQLEPTSRVFIVPARHVWDLKGQHLVLEAFARLSAEEKERCRLRLMEWGPDLPRTQALVLELGLSRWVEWVPVLPKLDLWEAFADARTIVIDQFPTLDFHGGSLGGVARDAMAVGAPLITHARPVTQRRLHHETPPVLHSECEALAIRDQLRHCLSCSLADLYEMGGKNRAWLAREHGIERVIPEIMAVHERLFGRR